MKYILEFILSTLYEYFFYLCCKFIRQMCIPEKIQDEKQSCNSKAIKELILLCRIGNWNVFKIRCSIRKEDCIWKGKYGQTLLHFASSRRPTLDAISNLIEIYPDALLIKDIDDCLPIHMAMANGASDSVLGCMIQKAPSSVLVSNKWGYTPFEWLWNRYKNSIKNELTKRYKSSNNTEQDWDIVKLLIRAASATETGCFILSDDPIIHLATDFNCPLDLFEILLETYNSDIWTRDDLGRLPLSRAASSRRCSLKAIQSLIRKNQTALVETDNHGSLPFHIAAANGMHWNEGLSEMFYAYPDAIRIRDPKTNLFPCMLSAASNSSSLDDVYNLLRECPDIITH